jgi:threonine dehydrogenase-like Zn-dependent dehydrogenase
VAGFKGKGDQEIVTTLCPSGKERMRRLIRTVESDRLDPLRLIAHPFALATLPQPTTSSAIVATAC